SPTPIDWSVRQAPTRRFCGKERRFAASFSGPPRRRAGDRFLRSRNSGSRLADRIATRWHNRIGRNTPVPVPEIAAPSNGDRRAGQARGQAPPEAGSMLSRKRKVFLTSYKMTPGHLLQLCHAAILFSSQNASRLEISMRRVSDDCLRRLPTVLVNGPLSGEKPSTNW